MGLLDWFKRKAPEPPGRWGLDELARRLNVSLQELQAVQPAYREFTIPKRSGGTRTILEPQPELKAIQAVIWMTKQIVADEGYRLHQKKKLRIMRRHNRQQVTGLVVNARPNLPRPTRRWLRAVEHHLRAGRPVTLSPQQVEGWRALQAMIAAQTANPEP